MARYQHYLTTTVVEEARKRVAHIFDVFDSVVVSFSGGKDSLVALHLAREEAERRGQLPLDVVFRDEELIPDSVIDFVDGYRRQDWLAMLWFCYPMANSKYVLGEHTDYIQWDPSREHIRPMPSWAITPTDDHLQEFYTQHTMDEICFSRYKGRIGVINGIRASESLVRYRSVVEKLNENYINVPRRGTFKRMRFCKAIYDWKENDIFKWLADNDIDWCPLYEAQHLSGHGLRVATPLHPEAAKRFAYWRRIDPDFAQRVLDAFPDMALQERYYAEYDFKALVAQYSDGWEGVQRYIDTRITDKVQQHRAMELSAEMQQLARNDPDSYNPALLMNTLLKGSLERTVLPGNRDKTRPPRRS